MVKFMYSVRADPNIPDNVSYLTIFLLLSDVIFVYIVKADCDILDNVNY